MKYLFIFLVLIPMMVFAQEVVEEDIAQHWAVQILDWGTNIIGVASVIAAMTPTKKDNAFLSIFATVLNALAFNFGKAENKKKP